MGAQIVLSPTVWEKVRLGCALVRNLPGAQLSLCVAFLNGAVHALFGHHYFASVVCQTDHEYLNSLCRATIRSVGGCRDVVLLQGCAGAVALLTLFGLLVTHRRAVGAGHVRWR